MAELLNDEEELEFQRKMRVKRRFRGLLIVINMLLACYLIFAAGTAIVEIINNKNQSKDTVLLCDKGEGASLKIYDDFIKESIYGDFAIYGDDLHLRQTNYDINKSDTFDNVQLVNVCSKSGAILSSYRYNDHGKHLNRGINLFQDTTGKSLGEGFYIFYSEYIDVNNRGKVIRVNTDEKIEHTFFSIPDQDGRRTKATIFSYPKNKALILKIEHVTKLPDNYYDIVLFGDSSKFVSLIGKLEEKNLKIKTLDNTLYTYADVYHINASRAIILKNGEVEKIQVSSHVDSTYENSDDIIFLELGAYAFFNGSLAEFYTEHIPGKMVFLATFVNDIGQPLIDELAEFANI